ncbi:MAG: RNA polymerase subunit sigma [Micavibrio aeruginosavorus]|uniref:RNA polymerase subunit sigma n=1 Tax=Micavibrio aeruginosavorus TaxID=349221 RepID=A0A2W5PKN1_9BACT|nr:MAG: RNA polymerase subunit sigma [Micavibrio aeruginosavorus]
MNKNSIDLEMDLKRLVMETRQGNKTSYNNLLLKLAPLLKKGAVAHLSRFGRTNYSEDVLQETFLAIHLKLHTYDEDQPFLAWVRAVMKHKIIDHLRRHKVKVVSIEDTDFWEPADEATPDAVSITYDLQNLLNTLKPPAGQIIYDMKVDGMSVQELSTRYNISEGNIKVIVHRGLKKLSDMMRKESVA